MDPTTPTPSADAASPNESGKAAPSPASPAVDDWHLPRHSDEELKQLARDLVAGHITSDRHLDAHQFKVSFSILACMSDAQLAVLRAEAGLVYEYNHQATTNINGYPFFMSAKFLHRDHLPQLQQYVAKIRAALADL